MKKMSPMAARLTEMKMGGHSKPSKPSLHISAHLDSFHDDSSYRKEELQRRNAEVKELESRLKSFNAKWAADMVKKSLETELAVAKARLAESQARARN